MHREQCLLYESGELAAGERAEFERHLEGCAECRERLETARAAHRWARGAAPEPPRRLTAAVLIAAGGAPAAGRAGTAGLAFAAMLFALSLARGLAPLLPGAAEAREDLERLRGDLRRLEVKERE